MLNDLQLKYRECKPGFPLADLDPFPIQFGTFPRHFINQGKESLINCSSSLIIRTRCSPENWLRGRINRSQKAGLVLYTIKGNTNTHNGIGDLIGIKRYKTVSRFGYYLSRRNWITARSSEAVGGPINPNNYKWKLWIGKLPTASFVFFVFVR